VSGIKPAIENPLAESYGTGDGVGVAYVPICSRAYIYVKPNVVACNGPAGELVRIVVKIVRGDGEGVAGEGVIATLT
jgi:hypothetical protein